MKFKTAIAALFALGLGATSAQAAPSVAAYSVPNVTTFKANNLASKLKITVEGYVAAGDGGKADYQYSAVDCTERPGKCLHDGAGNAFTRTDPSEHLAAWGFVSGGAYDWATHGVSSADASPVIMAAQAENATKGIATTNCDGAQIYLATDLVLAGGGLKFTCGVMPGVTTDNAGYLNLPGTIRKAHGVRIHRAADGTEFYGAFILPYHYTSAPTTAQQGSVLIQKTIDDADTGVECDQKSCIDHDLTILGFDTGYEAFQSPNSVWNNITVDANVCFWIQKVGGNTNNQNFNCGPYLTRSIDPTKKNQFFDISKIENDGGLCKVTVTPHSVTDDVADIQYASWIFIARVNSTSASCNGRWKISNLVVGSGTASFDLVGSAVLGPSSYSHWATGSSIIYTSNIGNIEPGNVITGFAANGIPNGTTVSYVWPLPVHPSGYTTTTGSANAYVATEGSVAPCRLADSLNEYLTPNFTNTGAATLNIALNVACGGGTSGAIPILRADGTALQANDIVSGANTFLVLNSDATAWLLQQAKIILSTPTTLAQTANVLVGYTNAICSSCGSNARAEFTEGARIDAGGSQGGIAAGGAGNATGVMVGGPVAKGFGDTNKVAGFTCTDCTVFDHSIDAHVQNSNNTKFADWRTDSEGSTDNDEQYLMLVDGQSNSMQLTGVKSAKAGIGFLVNIAYPNNPDKACATWNDASIASSAGTFPIMDVEQGCMRTSNGQSSGQGVNFISNLAAEARFDVYMPNATNIYEGAAAKSVTCTAGSTLAGGNTCQNLTNIVGVGVSKEMTAATTMQAGDTDINSYAPGSGAGKTAFTFPASPACGYHLRVSPGLQDMLLDFNGKVGRFSGIGGHDVPTLLLPFISENQFADFDYDCVKWVQGATTPLEGQAISPLSTQTIIPGQYALGYDGSTYFTLTPSGGPGGGLIASQNHQLPSTGLTSNKSNNTISVTNYYYWTHQGANVITGTSNSAGSILVALTTPIPNVAVGDKVGVHIFGVQGTLAANGRYSAVVTTDTSHILLTGPTYDAAYVSGLGDARVRIDYVYPSTTAPSATLSNGTQVKTGDTTSLYVGQAVIDGSHNPTSTTCAPVFGCLKTVAVSGRATDLVDGTTGSGTVVLSVAPTITGDLTTTGHHISNGTALASGDFVFGTGAGTSPTFTSVSGDDNKFRLSFSTGTTPATSAIVFTLTFKSAFGAAPVCMVVPENANSATKMVQVWVVPGTTTLVFNTGTVGLVASTAYVYSFTCTQ